MFFQKKSPDVGPHTTDGTISGESTVAQWLDHPAGGTIFREMLAQAGQNESVLRPVRRLSLNRLIKLSQGKFTQEMLDDMVRKANSGEVSAVQHEQNTPAEVNAEPELPTWQEKITDGRFAGKTIIVTGAGSGIGRATASRIAREGGRVVAVDLSNERLDELKNELPEAQIELVSGDITDDGVITKIVQSAGERIDGLANVAGIMDNMTPLHEVSDEIWSRVMSVNVTSMMKLSRAVMPHMLAVNKGAIVNVGSEASLKASVAGAAYVTSKHAVAGLSKSMAFMYGPSGIRTNMVAPGAVLTNIEARFDSKLGEERVNSILGTMPDAAESAELAAVITYLLSDDSVNINGALLPSDAGWSVQ
jgi:NAD(P)-dependent dehydrogenase (short-subunit alcohol dehydrogenase family)